MAWVIDRQSLVVGLISGAAVTLLLKLWLDRKEKEPNFVDGVDGLIGNTPLMRIRSLSEATGCTVLFLNPGGSAKDRVALNIIRSAEEAGILTPHKGSTVFEGTVGSTGISIAMIARAKGYKAWIVMPDDQAQEKYQFLEKLGATVEKVRPVSIIDKKQFVNLAKTRAEEFGEGEARGYFANQFENDANYQVHYQTTAPEIYRQIGTKLDALVLGAGTGGTLSGLALYLKPRIKELKVFLADPLGSGLFNKVKYNVMYAPTEREGTRKRHQVDTVVEGIGINRLTNNFNMGRHLVDDAFRVTDEEAVKMARFLVREDGLFLGSSSAVNCVAAFRAAKQLGPGHVIVTLLNDSGQRHLTKFWSDEYLEAAGIPYNLQGSEGLDDFIA
ncbi:tryptophan synthase beta subunit-like PLP-dependent enzyme [Zychaea mexicana]|uniref:tryptophan synthase beta subunit-like PLP-dependent enzyme n=1 Tax=Zychaea mexicana TaxID=64656 RepID=UPI0022FE682B|nr:tryptophan synthase beta subunit-like PLP-dependent enzyme [Zychaea mexicana]KAI9492459.1 tryptophan synthase beta subunit-like PLP-dependent enzyme [Zychaea mexicana]